MDDQERIINTALLDRSVVEIIDRKSLELRLGRRRPLRIKLGIDPTGHHIHLGHAVVLRKLAAWQAAGHHPILIIGDYTARVGDPSGKDKARSALSEREVKDFAATYIEQVGRILNVKKTEIRYNSEWLSRMTPNDFIRLLSTMTVNQVLAHDTFRRRLDRGQSLSLHELTYPLLQGYDSVAVEADVELGALEQKFNLLAGREVQRAYGQEPQEVMILDYLLGTDGKEKMSKTLNNFIALDDPPAEMYGKVMSIPDKAILPYFELATDTAADDITVYRTALRKKTENPRDIKAKLAQNIVAMYNGPDAAQAAAEEFHRVFRKRAVPLDTPVISITPGEHNLIALLVSHQLVASRTEARRLIEQGGVRIDREVVADWNATITVRDGMVLQVGKRKFLKLSTRA